MYSNKIAALNMHYRIAQGSVSKAAYSIKCWVPSIQEMNNINSLYRKSESFNPRQLLDKRISSLTNSNLHPNQVSDSI